MSGVHARARRRVALALLLLLGAIAAYVEGLGLLQGSLSPLLFVPLLLPALLAWLWHRPVHGVYLLLGAAVAQETQFTAAVYPDDVGRSVPLFQDFATWTHVSGLSFSAAELLMLALTLIWWLKGVGTRSLRLDRGTLMRPLGLYLCMVAVGEAHGLTSGGDWKLSLWEVRSQVYLLICYVLACNLITSRREVHTALWIMLVAAGLKGVQGTIRLYYSLHGDLHSVESLFPHEQSFFFNAFLTFTAVLYMFNGERRMRRVALIFLPFVAVSTLANQRRAAVLALVVALLLLLLLTAVVHPARRRAVAVVLAILAVTMPLYYLRYQNQSGLLAGPARAIASAFTPDARDASSNLYRVNEDKDILATARMSPILGYGFGKTMLTPYPLADISRFYVFWNLLPHNSILWIWMRMGAIGFALFLLLIGRSVLQAVALAQRAAQPFVRGMGIWIALLVIQEVIFGYLDLQWTNYRNLIALGIVLALLGKLDRPDEAAQRVAPGDESKLRSSRLRARAR